MIFRLSNKLSNRLGIELDQCLATENNPFIDWSAHLFDASRKLNETPMSMLKGTWFPCEVFRQMKVK